MQNLLIFSFHLTYLSDHRSMEFKVLTTIITRAHNPAHACLSTTNTNTFHEPIPDSYTIDLSRYRYTVLSPIDNNDSTAHNVASEGFVYDLPGFQYVDQDCNAIMVSDKSRWVSLFTTLIIHCVTCPIFVILNFLFSFIHFLYDRPRKRTFLVPTCQPGYIFPLPDLSPHSALLLTYTANKRLLSREHQPIDASRGAVVPPAVLYTCNALSGEKNYDVPAFSDVGLSFF